MKFNFLIPMTLIFCFALFNSCNANADETDVQTWLTRSCIGEAGWKSHETGECAAILHVYSKRAEIGNKPIEWIAKRYSAAIKKRANRHNPWVLYINRECTKPKEWPKLKWVIYKPDCKASFEMVHEFLAGNVADPLPNAVHYGSRIDHHRALRAGWWKLKSPFRNWFYSVGRIKK